MKIRFSPPLDKIMDPTRALDSPRPVRVAHVLRIMAEQTPAFAPYAGFTCGDKHAYGLLVWRDGNLLELEDIVEPNDALEMIAMVAGG